MVAIASEQYISLTTFTRDGRPKPAPVWIVDLGNGDVGFTTGSDSWKVKRINNTPDVTMQGCDQRGRVREGAPIVKGSARLATPGEIDTIKGLVKEKYGVMVTVVAVMGAIGKLLRRGEAANTAVVVSVD